MKDLEARDENRHDEKIWAAAFGSSIWKDIRAGTQRLFQVSFSPRWSEQVEAEPWLAYWATLIYRIETNEASSPASGVSRFLETRKARELPERQTSEEVSWTFTSESLQHMEGKSSSPEDTGGTRSQVFVLKRRVRNFKFQVLCFCTQMIRGSVFLWTLLLVCLDGRADRGTSKINGFADSFLKWRIQIFVFGVKYQLFSSPSEVTSHWSPSWAASLFTFYQVQSRRCAIMVSSWKFSVRVGSDNCHRHHHWSSWCCESPWQRLPTLLLQWISGFIAVTWLSAETLTGCRGDGRTADEGERVIVQSSPRRSIDGTDLVWRRDRKVTGTLR